MPKTSTNSPSSDIANVYLFSGEVDARRTNAVNELVSKLIDPSFADFDLEKFDGDNTSAAAILSAVSTVPFGSPRKVVIVDRIDRLNPDDQNKIASFLPGLGTSSCLIMLAGEDSSSKRRTAQPAKEKSAEKDEEEDEEQGPQKRKKGLQPKLSAAVKKEGQVVSFAKMKAQDLNGLVAQIVRGTGKKIESLALQNLGRSLQSHPSLAEKEVEKLVAWIGERDTITTADVDRVSTKSPEDRVFPLIDAIATCRADTAVHLLEETFAASTKPDGEVTKVLALLAKHIRMLYQVKYVVTQGRVRHLGQASEEIRSLLMHETNPMAAPDWQKGRLLEQAQHFTLGELKKALRLILECELAVKGQSRESSSPRLSMEMLVLKLSHRRPASR